MRPKNTLRRSSGLGISRTVFTYGHGRVTTISLSHGSRTVQRTTLRDVTETCFLTGVLARAITSRIKPKQREQNKRQSVGVQKRMVGRILDVSLESTYHTRYAYHRVFQGAMARSNLDYALRVHYLGSRHTSVKHCPGDCKGMEGQ